MFLTPYWSIMFRKCAEKILSKKAIYIDPVITKTDILYIIYMVYILHNVLFPFKVSLSQVSKAPCWIQMGRVGVDWTCLQAVASLLQTWRGSGSGTRGM